MAILTSFYVFFFFSCSKMNANQISEQLQKYETYVNEVLKSDLNRVCLELDRVIKDLAEYQQLRETIALMLKRKENDETYEFTTDIGSNFFARVIVDDMSSILLELGLGYYLDFTLPDALRFIEAREKFLNSKLVSLRDQSGKIKAHIKLLLMYCQELYPGASTDSRKVTKL